MDKIYLATIRDIWYNKSRSVVIILAIMMVVSFPIAFLNVAPNLTTIVNEEEKEFQLAHYNIFFDRLYDISVQENIRTHITDFLDDSSKKFIVEPRVFQSTKMRSDGRGSIEEGIWIDLDIMAIENNKLPQVSQLKLIDGKYPNSDREMAMLDSLAIADGLKIGDKIDLFDKTGSMTFTLVGLIKTIEYTSYELSQSGIVYVTLEGMEQLIDRSGLKDLANEVSIFFDYNITLVELQDLSDYLKEKLSEDGVNIALFWFVRETSFRRALLDALTLTTQYMTAASIFIFLVAGIVIFVVTNRYITEQKKRIGAVYAFGVNRRKIMTSFFLRVLILSIFGIVLGLIISQILLRIIIEQLAEEWGLIGFSREIEKSTIIFTLTSATIVAYLSTFLAVTNLIKLTPYEAMRGKSSELKNKGIFFKLSSSLPTKLLRGAAKNLTRNRTRTLLTVIAFTTALTFSGSLIYTNQSMDYTIDVFFEDKVNFDVEVNLGYNTIGLTRSTVVEEILNNQKVSHSEYFINNLVPLSYRPEVLTFLVGLQSNTSMYDISDSNLVQGRWFNYNGSEIVISTYLQFNYNIELNSELAFDFFGFQINVTVVGITNDIMYSSAIFVDLDYLNGLLTPLIYPFQTQNTVLANKLLLQLDDKKEINKYQDELNKNNRNVNIALTQSSYYNRAVALAESQTAIIILMVTLGLIVGVVSVFTTLLIAIVERERELALLRVFGYRSYELFFQVLLEGWMIGIIAFVPALFLARFTSINLWMKIISDNIYVVSPNFPKITTLFIFIFTIVSISLSIIPAFRMATERKISETIREE